MPQLLPLRGKLPRCHRLGMHADMEVCERMQQWHRGPRLGTQLPQHSRSINALEEDPVPSVNLYHAASGRDRESRHLNDAVDACLVLYRGQRPPGVKELENLVVVPRMDVGCAPL